MEFHGNDGCALVRLDRYFSEKRQLAGSQLKLRIQRAKGMSNA
jgi:hypothetical protein